MWKPSPPFKEIEIKKNGFPLRKQLRKKFHDWETMYKYGNQPAVNIVFLTAIVSLCMCHFMIFFYIKSTC